MKNIEILEFTEEFVNNHKNDHKIVFENNVKKALNEIVGLGKKNKFLKNLIIDLQIEKKQCEKNMFIIDNSDEKRHNRMYINNLSLKILYAKKQEISIKKERDKSKQETSAKRKYDLNYKYKVKNEKKEEVSIDELVSNIDEYELSFVLKKFSNYIKKLDLENDVFLDEYIDIINNRLIDYMVEEEDICEEFYLLTELLKNKSLSYKKDTIERKKLKNALNKLKYSYQVYKREDKKEISPYFHILDYWLKDDDNYLYIKELLRRNKELCNIKYNDKHIIVYILDLYINNFKKMIKDKESEYININYLKEVYFLFSKNYHLRISEDDKNEIDLKLREFKTYIKETLIKQKRKNAAIEDIKSLSTKKYYKDFNYYAFEEFTDDLLCYEKNDILRNISSSVKDKEYNEAFLYGGYAYNIRENESGIHITMYAIDISNFIVRNSLMDRYLEKCEMLKENIDSFTSDSFKLKKDEIYPVFAYDLEFYQSGKFKSLNIKKDIIKIREKYFNINSEEPKKLHELYEKSVQKNGGYLNTTDLYALNNHFNGLLNKVYIDFLSNGRLPSIYYGYTIPTEAEINSNMNNLNNYLSRLGKVASSEVINIFSSKIDVNHYSNLPIPNGVHDFKLMEPFCYLGVENERMLDDLYFNQRKYTDENRIYRLKLQYLREYIKKVDELNKNINYVDATKIKISKGKIKNKIRL